MLAANSTIHDVAKQTPMLEPYILAFEKRTFLVCDKKVICELKRTPEIPLTLLAAFFIFNVCYPKGSTNFYAFMEIMTLAFPMEKAIATVKHFITSLTVLTLAHFISAVCNVL